jgi:hypothetical protein
MLLFLLKDAQESANNFNDTAIRLENSLSEQNPTPACFTLIRHPAGRIAFAVGSGEQAEVQTPSANKSMAQRLRQGRSSPKLYNFL